MFVWCDTYDSICNTPLVDVLESELDSNHPSVEFLHYWRDLNGGNTPARTSFNPQHIGSLLKWLMMFRREMHGKDDVYFLYLQGNSAAELTDGLQQGNYLQDFTDDACFNIRREALRSVLKNGQPAFASIIVGEKWSDFTTSVSVGIFPFTSPKGQPEVVMVPAPSLPEMRLYL